MDDHVYGIDRHVIIRHDGEIKTIDISAGSVIAMPDKIEIIAEIGGLNGDNR